MRTIMRGRISIKSLLAKLSILVLVVTSVPTAAEWSLDLSRRRSEFQQKDLKATPAQGDPNFLEKIFTGGGPTNDIVILNTDKGFVPQTVRLRKGLNYMVHVVNVNEKEKNVSFILDAFSEHHATYYGRIKSFRVEPQKEGLFSFQCPETSLEGQIVVFSGAATQRLPASE